MLFTSIRRKWNDLMHNEELKHKIYMIIYDTDKPIGRLFDVVLIGFIFLSVLIVIIESMSAMPDVFKPYLHLSEWIFTIFFTMEYILRIYCVKNPKKYIFSFFGIVDLLSTLPTYLGFFITSAHSLLAIRILRLIRVFRVFKLFSFWNEGQVLLAALKASSKKITVFFVFIVLLVVSIGTLMYMVEGNVPGSSFTDIPNSIYWAIVTTTTVGYGDITPITGFGRFLSAIVMLIGYTVLAVPTGIVSASMISEHKRKLAIPCPHCHKPGHEDEAVYCKFCGKPLRENDDEIYVNEPIITTDGEIK